MCCGSETKEEAQEKDAIIQNYRNQSIANNPVVDVVKKVSHGQRLKAPRHCLCNDDCYPGQECFKNKCINVEI